MKKFLVVVDMQKDFVDGALGTAEAVAIVDNVVKKIEEYKDDEVIVTYDTHFEDYMETLEGANLPVPHCIKGTDGHKLDAKVQAAIDALDEYYEVEKNTFGSTLLPDIIEEILMEEADIDADDDMTVEDIQAELHKIDFEIELVGLCTDICVVSNALLLKANFPEKQITVDASCCAGVSPETHNAAIATMQCCQIKVI